MIAGIKEALGRSTRRNASRRIMPDASLDMGIETLERRKMLAGDVSVNVRGDNLIIKGDNADNDIEIYESGGTVWVDGLNGTTLSKDASGTSFDTGINAASVNKLKVKLKGGDDSLEIYAGITANKTKINLGKGEDYLDVLDITSSKKFVANTGAGDDTVYIDGTYNKAKLKTGSGDDDVEVGNFAGATFAGRTVAKLGQGDDTLDVGASVLASTSTKIRVNGGGGGADELVTGLTSEADVESLTRIRVSKVEIFS